MGADLFIYTLYKPQRRKWERKFNQAVKRCESLTPESEERRRAQAEVDQAYERMYECGYFRDWYNSYSLLWKFGLSWWDDVIPMLDSDGDLSPTQAKSLLGMLKENQARFQSSLSQLSQKERKYYLDRYADLQKFLNEAIELGEPIHASL